MTAHSSANRGSRLEKPMPKIRLLAWWLAPCSAGLITASAWTQHPLFDRFETGSTYAAARDAVYQPLARQAQNGTILDQTVWNHHFKIVKDGKSFRHELHVSGYYCLDRL